MHVANVVDDHLRMLFNSLYKVLSNSGNTHLTIATDWWHLLMLRKTMIDTLALYNINDLYLASYIAILNHFDSTLCDKVLC